MPLKVDFLESGIGETILITLPDGRQGIIDAHPSPSGLLRVLSELSSDHLAFICLTHPHEDHGLGFVEILDSSLRIDEFWHTASMLGAWMYSADQYPSFPSQVQEVADEFMRGLGNFIRNVYGKAQVKGLRIRTLHSGLAPIEMAGVSFHVLAPEEDDQYTFDNAYRDILLGQRKSIPDPNLLSAILLVEHEGKSILLGGDALIKRWHSALAHHRKRGLPDAALLKVPHHGASNAFPLAERDANTYLGLCEADALGVLFAGDSKHPDPRVLSRLENKLQLHCLINGYKAARRNPAVANPLGLAVPGARAVRPQISSCQPKISASIDTNGFALTAGLSCTVCP